MSNGYDRAEGVATFAYANLDQNDSIEIWIENLTDTDNVTALAGGLVSVSERPS